VFTFSTLPLRETFSFCNKTSFLLTLPLLSLLHVLQKHKKAWGDFLPFPFVFFRRPHESLFSFVWCLQILPSYPTRISCSFVLCVCVWGLSLKTKNLDSPHKKQTIYEYLVRLWLGCFLLCCFFVFFRIEGGKQKERSKKSFFFFPHTNLYLFVWWCRHESLFRLCRVLFSFPFF